MATDGGNFFASTSLRKAPSTMMIKSFKLVIALSVFALVKALDVEITSVSCDDSLAVTADFNIKCKDGATKRCTFGEQITVYGTRK